MSLKNNVISLDKFRSRQQKGLKKKKERREKPNILDMTERRQEILREERREVRRTILTEFVGAYAVIPANGLVKVALYDISEKGVAFDMPPEAGQFKNGEEVALRVYMNRQTYFPFVVRIQNSRYIEDEEVNRFGADFIPGDLNEKALFHFVRFIENVSASLRRDNGDIMVSNLKN